MIERGGNHNLTQRLALGAATVALAVGLTSGCGLADGHSGFGEASADQDTTAKTSKITKATSGISRAVSEISNDPHPVAESEQFQSGHGDVEDDMALVSNSSNSDKSVIVAAQKRSKGGLSVFDMQGQLIKQAGKDYVEYGAIGNIDHRRVKFGGKTIELLAADDRKHQTLEFWTLDPDTQQLSGRLSARAIKPDTGTRIYGSCIYHSAKTGKVYDFITPVNGGNIVQEELIAAGNGLIDAKPVRSLPIKTTTEGCVADDELGYLYADQEDVGIRKFHAEPGASTEGTLIAKDGDHIHADIEGIGLAKGKNNTGYLVVSSQKRSEYVRYDRVTNEYIDTFKITAGNGIDGVTDTDGLDITTDNMGTGFEYGALVVHDNKNTGSDHQHGDPQSNYKIVPLVKAGS